MTVRGGEVGKGEGVVVPGVDILGGWKDFLTTASLLCEKSLQLEEFGLRNFILQWAEPTLVEGVDLKLEKLLLFVREFGEPGVFVKLRGFSLSAIGSAVRNGLGRPKEGRDAPVIVG